MEAQFNCNSILAKKYRVLAFFSEPEEEEVLQLKYFESANGSFSSLKILIEE